MESSFAVYRPVSAAVLVLLAGFVAGCAITQPDRPPVMIDRDGLRADGKKFIACKPPKAVDIQPDCRGLRGATVIKVDAVTILTTVTNPKTCHVYTWGGSYWEYCYEE